MMDLFIFLNILLWISFVAADVPITVHTTKGRISGTLEYKYVDGEQKLLATYTGIPYAETTAGENRFQKPIPKAPFTTPFNARKTPLACYQQTRYEMDVLKHRYGVPGFTEDCLTLNIYAPYRLGVNFPLPVMVWIYGGGFRQGAASMYNPEGLALFGDVVVVTVNYRVGMFGFLRDSSGTVVGNQGLWDIHLALKWINTTIGSFHGNPDDVTLFGQSSGGAAALLQAMYIGNKGLFKRVIAESGSPLAPWSFEDIDALEEYLKETGCQPNTNNTLLCLQSKDPMILMNNRANLGPVVDGDFLIAKPEEILLEQTAETHLARQVFASVDILLGFNDGDGVLYYNTWSHLLGQATLDFNVTRLQFDNVIVPEFIKTKLSTEYTPKTRKALEELLTFFYTDWADPLNLLTIRNTLIAMTNDPMFHVPAIQVAKTHAGLKGGSTYFYEFSVQSDKHALEIPPWFEGSYHADEIPYVFGFPLLANASIFGGELSNYTVEEQQLSRDIMTFWTNFARSGNPNTPNNATDFWPEFSMTSQNFYPITNILIEPQVTNIEEFHPRRMAFWSELVPNLIKLLQTDKTKPGKAHVSVSKVKPADSHPSFTKLIPGISHAPVTKIRPGISHAPVTKIRPGKLHVSLSPKK
ncbi:cholinesterase-like [Ruditapes philippinarum]|uniref:cholinesterase-like n=1 Tax=Ruditapes philippinarum TaxID=129788 RepID=UPI00295B2037|nr:cholinesterase-like [Ruditapes philippinarum]